MSKPIIAALLVILLIVGVVILALSRTGIDDANPQPQVIELEDNFET